MSNHSAIPHCPNYHFLKIEEDYLVMCQALKNNKQSAHCKALLLAVLEHWTNDKLSKEKDGYIYMTYAQWEESIYGFFGRTAIIACLSELLRERLISKRTHTLPDGKTTFAYVLNIPLIQKKLRALPERPGRPPRPNLDASKNGCPQSEARPKTDADPSKNGCPQSEARPKTDADPSKNGCFIDSSDTDSCIDSSDTDSDSNAAENAQESENDQAPDGAVVGLSSCLEKTGGGTPPLPPPVVSEQVESQRAAWFEHLANSPLSAELVRELADYYLPLLPVAVSKDRREANMRQWHEAAQQLAKAPELQALPPDRAKIRLAELLGFVTDPTSPSWWVQEFPRLRAGNQVRLWHVAKNSFEIGADLDKSGWLPADELLAALRARCQCGDCWECRWRMMDQTRTRVLEPEPDIDREPTVTPETDMALASQIVEAVLVPDALEPAREEATREERGSSELIPIDTDTLSFEVCMTLLAHIRAERPGYFVIHGKLQQGAGYVIHVHHTPGEAMATIASPGDWDRLLDALARRPRLTLAQRMERARAKRREQQERRVDRERRKDTGEPL